MTLTRVRYGRLSRHARDNIRWMSSRTIAGYIRRWFPDGTWRGDACGCPDDRCIGYHHDESDDCSCLESTLAEYAVDLGRASVDGPTATVGHQDIA